MKSKEITGVEASVGQRIIEVRKKILRISQEKLADGVDVTLRTIQRYESGESIPPESFYSKLSKLSMLINVDWVKTGNGSCYNFLEQISLLSIDNDIDLAIISDLECKEKLKLAIAEIRMLRATLAHKELLLNIIVNQ